MPRLRRQRVDPYVKTRSSEGWRSRSSFKLLELQEKFDFLPDVTSNPNPNFIPPPITCLDLGAAPGGWSQVITKTLGLNSHDPDEIASPGLTETRASASSSSRLIAVDLLPIEPILGCSTIVGDFTHLTTWSQIEAHLAPFGNKVNVIVSDMAPSMTGINAADEENQMQLLEAILMFTEKYLRPKSASIPFDRSGTLM